jgi:O-antigen/teichoic acid export membrane protein
MIKKLFTKYHHLSQLKKNVVSGSIFFCINTLITIASYPLYLHYISVKAYGVWSTVSVILMFGQLGQLGIGSAIIKFVATEYGKNDVRSITGYITTSFVILLIPSFIITLLVLIFNVPFLKFIKIDPVLVKNSYFLIIAVGLLSIFSLFVNIVRGAVVELEGWMLPIMSF